MTKEERLEDMIRALTYPNTITPLLTEGARKTIDNISQHYDFTPQLKPLNWKHIDSYMWEAKASKLIKYLIEHLEDGTYSASYSFTEESWQTELGEKFNDITTAKEACSSHLKGLILPLIR